jgi:hypothetical protein
MREARATKRARGEQLVVCGDERGRRVEHVDARCRESLELLRARLDPVELFAHVEPPQRDVTRLEDAERVARGQHGCRQTERGCGAGERNVRLALTVSDDDELHGSDGEACARNVGVALVTLW